MVHPVASSGDPAEPLEHIRALIDTACDATVPTEETLEAAFAHETNALGLPYAWLSAIDLEAGTERFEVVYGEGLPVSAGDTVPLSESYCRHTIEQPDGTLAISDAAAEGWVDDPAYQRFGVGTYMGATVEANDRLHGTLCFVRPDPREESLAEPEIALAGVLAEWVGYERSLEGAGLERSTEAPGLERVLASATPDEQPSTEPPTPMWTSEVDTLVDAIAARPRRTVLSLLREGSIDSLAALEDRASLTERDAVALQHNHLPRLADAGFIEWDRESGVIAKGPAFDDVDRVLQCIEDTVEEVA